MRSEFILIDSLSAQPEIHEVLETPHRVLFRIALERFCIG